MKLKNLCFLLTLTLGNVLLSQDLNPEETKLYEQIMEYRKQNNLPIIPLSKSLTIVAQTHARDLEENYDIKKIKRCNLHTWSRKGKWTSCCYTPNHKKAKCMWDKPKELTSYHGSGYEIVHWQSNGSTAENALKGWKRSKGHNAIIINSGKWHRDWNAIGIGIVGNYATVWFGFEKDVEL